MYSEDVTCGPKNQIARGYCRKPQGRGGSKWSVLECCNIHIKQVRSTRSHPALPSWTTELTIPDSYISGETGSVE